MVENAFGQPQTVLVLGGTSDIALAVLERLCAQRTRTVVLVGRDEAALARADERLRSAGATTVHTVVADAGDVASAGPAVESAVSALHAPLDVAIVATGLLGSQAEDEDDAARAGQVAVVNFAWPVAALAALRRVMVAQGSGRILVLSSVAAIRVRAAAYLYGGAKAGLDRLSIAMGDSLMGSGVSVQVVRPGFVRTKMTAGQPDAPFAVDVDVVADDIVAGLATGRRIITTPRHLGPLFLVLRHLPASLWRRAMSMR